MKEQLKRNSITGVADVVEFLYLDDEAYRIKAYLAWIKEMKQKGKYANMIPALVAATKRYES
jgi:hypothetical protein